MTLHVHAAIWEEIQPKVAMRGPIKHFREIERLLTAIHCPKEIAVMHCKGHSRVGSKAVKGNQLADCQGRKAELWETPLLPAPLIWTGPVEQGKPQYTEGELERYEKRGAKITNKGWLQSKDGRSMIPKNAQWKILKGLHQSFHLGVESTYQMVSHLFEGKNVMKTLKNIIKRCEMCKKSKPKTETLAKSGFQRSGKYPGEDWEIDFTHIQRQMEILAYKFEWIPLLDGLRLFPIVVNRLRRL